jgi:type I restriction enzyme S subunit
MSEVPAHWPVRRLSDVVSLPSGQVDPRQAPHSQQVLIAPDHVESATGRLLELRTAADQDATSGKYVVRPGDVVYSKIRPALRKAVLAEHECICSADMYPMTPSLEIDSRYLLALLLSEGFSRFAESVSGRSGIPKINRQELEEFSVPLPPIGEQRRIAEVLNSVDEQIQISTRLIEKLGDMRLSSIREVAGPGLECFRGVEASELHTNTQRSIGSWLMTPLGCILKGIDAGHSPDLEDTPAGPGQWGVLKVSAVGADGFRPAENKVVWDNKLYDSAICVRTGDLLMTRANTSQLVGRSCIVDDTPPGLMLCDKTLRLRVDERSVPTRYIHIVLGLAEIRRQIEIAATGTSGSMKNISQHSIRQLMIPMGSLDDIKHVVEIDELHEAKIAALRREVDTLRLLKQGLMDDLLSGRIQVPEHV